ncbi:MAG: D-sedoheptulose 7-phosphate isomerase [Acidobacteria bacterium]|nr:D-sedoheptulose 7-phosphate isomerase [Acidobacteriota bacterium]
MKQLIRQAVAESVTLKQSFFEKNLDVLVAVAQEIIRSYEKRGKVLLFGNGGSAADAQHIAAEFVNRFGSQVRQGLSAFALTTDTSVLTSIGNDLGFDLLFSRQIEAHGRPGDVAIAISTSGDSPNVLKGAEQARAQGLVTVGLTGRDGGRLASLVQYHLNVPHAATSRVQEIHIMIGHLICHLVESQMFPAR